MRVGAANGSSHMAARQWAGSLAEDRQITLVAEHPPLLASGDLLFDYHRPEPTGFLPERSNPQRFPSA